MPDKPERRVAHNKTQQKVAVGLYLAVLAIAMVNWVSPTSALPVVSFNWYAPQSFYWTLTIPPNATGFFGGLNETAVLNVTLTASQPLADGVPITVTVFGCERAKPNVTADGFVIGFTGAYDNKNPGTVYNGEQVYAYSFLYPKPPAKWQNNCPSELGANAVHFIGEVNGATFYFKNPGTYPVTLKAYYFPNFYPFGTPKQYNYGDNVIDVQSSAALSQGVIARAEALVVVATFAFGFFETWPSIKKHL